MEQLEHDFVVVGSGLAGLSTAYHASKYGSVAIITKANLDVSNSYNAQGGIAAAMLPEDSFESHKEDTFTAGRGLCDEPSVDILVKEGVLRVQELIDLGMSFDTEDGQLLYGLEGGHSHRRILHAGGDVTGRELTQFMASKVAEIDNIIPYEGTTAVDLLVEDGRCCGVKALRFKDQATMLFQSSAVILASGGVSRIYQRSTNPRTATGDGIALAWRHGAAVQDMEFIQFHPSALSIEGHDAFLISEAVRGEGAHILNSKGERFMTELHPLAELAPRDTVTFDIYREMQREGSKNVFLCLNHLDGEYIKKRFSSIFAEVKKFGYDLTTDKIPISPAAHYMVGGIQTDLHGETTLPGLWACGEVASTGVMGANRLASNSLLECIVFAKRVAERAKNDVALERKDIHVSELEYHEENEAVFLKYKNEMSQMMSEHVSIVRTEKELQKVKARLLEIEAQFCGLEPEYNISKILNMCQVCQLITDSALLRKESRGGHIRFDYRGTDIACEHHTVLQKDMAPWKKEIQN